jgi:Ca2+/Na+ antiporter
MRVMKGQLELLVAFLLVVALFALYFFLEGVLNCWNGGFIVAFCFAAYLLLLAREGWSLLQSSAMCP